MTTQWDVYPETFYQFARF